MKNDSSLARWAGPDELDLTWFTRQIWINHLHQTNYTFFFKKSALIVLSIAKTNIQIKGVWCYEWMIWVMWGCGWRNAKGEAKGCFCRSDMWVLLGNGRGDSRRGNVEWFRCSLDMNMFLQIQFRSGVKKERSFGMNYLHFKVLNRLLKEHT